MRRALVILSTLLLFASCGEKEPDYKGSPAVQLTVTEVSHTTVNVSVDCIFAENVYIVCSREETVPTAQAIISGPATVISGKNPTGRAETETIVIQGLEAGASYYIHAVATRTGGACSPVVSEKFSTSVEAGELYEWEKGRDGAPSFADITLCTGGGKPNSNTWFSVPRYWDADRFSPHVSYTDDNGEHWLFEAFLAITGTDMNGKNFGINPNGQVSAGKDSWEALACYWLDKGGAFDELDKAFGAAAARIGDPPFRRHVVMMMPDPIMLERFTDKASSTTYWGTLDGTLLDFSRIDDQVMALEWYIELVREKFNALGAQHLQLSGFYILSEELVARPEGFNYQYKRWDRILPRIGEYLNARNEGLYWIPYLGADGTDMWRDLGIDCAWLQPNYYWDYNGEKPIRKAFAAMQETGMGMELEFEYSMVEEVMKTDGIMGPDAAGNYKFTLNDVPSLRARFREYMDGYKNAGLYGKKPVALYSGSNAMYQLGKSKEKDDIAIYLELCRFITENPLRK